MKKLAVATVGAALLLTSAAVVAGIAGTKHDFSAQPWNPDQDLCEICHTPHNARPITDAPLWNHEVTLVNPYTLYPSGGTMNAVPGQPAGISRLCLSCHDGTVAVDEYGANPTTTMYVTGTALLGTNLSDSHPISFTYNTALATADGELFNPSVKLSGLGGTIAADMLFGVSNNQLECGSCHDVHDNSFTKFLIKSNASSALCLTCHNK